MFQRLPGFPLNHLLEEAELIVGSIEDLLNLSLVQHLLDFLSVTLGLPDHVEFMLCKGFDALTIDGSLGDGLEES